MSDDMRRVAQRVARESQGGAAKVWAEIIKLSQAPNIVSNLGQGFPDFQGSTVARDAANEIIKADVALNQYSPVPGTARLRSALIEAWKASLEAPQGPAAAYSAAENVMVTTSGTEALYSAMQAVVDPGDEVIIMEPFFPWYLPAVRMAGGTPVCLPLQPPGFQIDLAALAGKFSSKTKAVIFNTPHNPTGRVASREEVDGVAKLCVEHDVLLISDEVYEHFLFQDETGAPRKHLRIAECPGMAERTLTIGSSSKMFSLTGWRVGWVFGPADLVSAIGTCHAYNSYCAPTPLQDGVAAAVEALTTGGADGAVALELRELSDRFAANAKALADALATIKVRCVLPEGGYFLVADVRETGMTDTEFCRWMATEKGVICGPMSVFYATEGAPQHLVRFAICKTSETVDAAVRAITAESSN